MGKKLSITHKGNLCELFRQHSATFDKFHKGYKEKYVEENAW